jgi:predicted transcriptional regulator
MRKKRTQLAALQLAIMDVLWDRGEATVGEVRDKLNNTRSLAYTTVGTMLMKMERRGFVKKRRGDGRAYVYRPLIDREEVSRSMVSDLAAKLFAGDVSEMFCHLLAESDVSREELSRLKKLIRQKERELNDDE